MMKILQFAVILFSMLCPRCFSSSNQRPFYIIGHMVNSIGEIEEFLQNGSNVLETDIQFFNNGSVKEMHHGFPCDCGRYCDYKANLEEYLKHLRDITDPNKPGSYYEQLIMHFFDLKLETSDDIMESGRDIARHVLNYLWRDNDDPEQQMKVLIYFDKVKYKDVVLGFREEFDRQGQTERLKNVGFDGGSEKVSDIKKTLSDLNIGNVWLGDGSINCFSAFQKDSRLKEELEDRDSANGFIDKVYRWTIDSPQLMRKALRLAVDGMITNKPGELMKVLEESEFEKSFRVATKDDNPFERYTGE